MQGARSFVSSRMFGKDERPVPNIVAIYEKPRHKVRRDATHVFGGMFGWNKPEEIERALRAEDARAEVAATTTPTTSIPASDVVADSTLSGLAQQSGKRPVKRSKRRALVPLADMGASILSSHFQELMRRQQGIEEPEEQPQPPLSPPAKRPSTDVEDTPAVAEPVSGKKARVSATSADPPVTKKLRLTISTSSATPLQLPLSPPDTSSNASKAPADERPGPVSSTPKAALSHSDFPEFDLTNLSGTFSLSPVDSDSESVSSSESSSSSSSDSPDLSSSTSTRSTPKEQGKPQQKEKAAKKNAASNGRNDTPSAPASSTRGPSTPPKKKRPSHRPGWIGWVQTEESPDHSRLIRLDDAPVILGRRTRSGKEFQDPLPPPIRKRPPPAPSAAKPNADQPPRQKKARPRPSKANRRTGQKSKQQSAWQEAQRRANGESGSASEGRGDGEQTAELAFGDGELPATSADGSVPGEDAASSQTAPYNVASSTLASSASPSPTPIKLSPTRTLLPALGDPAPSVSVLEAAPASPVAVLKLTRSDAVITPTGARPNEEKDGFKKNSSLIRFTASPSKDTIHTNALASPDSKRSGTKDAQPKSNDATARPESRTLHRTASASALASSSKPTSGSMRPSDKAVNKTSLDRASPEKGGPMSELSENSPTLSMTTGGKGKEEKLESSMRYSAALAQFRSTKATPAKTSTMPGDTATASSSASSKAVKPFPMSASSRSDSKAETSSKSSAKPSSLALGKRKESSGQSSSQIRLKKRKLLWSSSDESETPKFVVNPFDRRGKQMELTRKGLSGDAFQMEMKKWMDAKKAEWKLKEREKAKERDKEKDKEVVGGSSEVRVATAESSAPKPKSETKPETIRTLSSFGIRPKGNDGQPRKRVWNVDWGMEFTKVSVAPHAVNGDKNRSLKMKERKDPEDGRERRNSDVATRESHAGKDRRESDAAERPYSALAKPKSRV